MTATSISSKKTPAQRPYGYGQIQDTGAFSAAPSGTFVFKAHNFDTSSRVGEMTIASGVISGTEDLLAAGILSTPNRSTPWSP